MAEVRRTPQAEADLDEILEHLHRTNPVAAERYATAFYDKGRALAQLPEILTAVQGGLSVGSGCLIAPSGAGSDSSGRQPRGPVTARPLPSPESTRRGASEFDG
jgi:plasmid stabilization system protein ParE